MAIKGEKQSRRTTNPGVRVIGGRIYDSSNGKTCHQCRQKTMDFVASCKGMKKDKQCTINFCHKCLINRYGENAEEVAKLEGWICPQCRGICNCSFCRKKRGLNPTGILTHKAKASGLASVSELLEAEGPDNFAYQKKPKLDVASMEDSSDNSDSVLEKDTKGADITKEKKKVVGKSTKALEEEIQFEAQLPQGISLTSVSGIVIPTEEAGNVFQLFEFCSAFGKALDLMEGQAETVVRELFISGRNSRRQQYCSIIPMMIQLLDLISQDREMSLSLSETDSSWFTAIGEILLQSEVSSDEFPPETFVAGIAEYEKMNASRRLKLLNFLCDESLSTLAMRNCINNQNAEWKAKDKEAKQRAAAAKEKEKQFKLKMQDDVAKSIMEKNRAPLSIEEHNLIMSQIRAEAKKAHEEMVEAKGMTSGTMLICDARRTEPIMLEENGLVLWKLKCYEEEPNILLQDLGTFDSLCPNEKWLAFKPEQKPEIENYISYKRRKLIQAQKSANEEKNANAGA
ncbi:PREDICTED: uncharacterized protein LOC104750585 [Camelina sativa]|uniref:Uncharacterized protein LOC104750585 n=1 Tax=Camelina sativa TaxID=90675 RepID=A0ABM0WGC4_CAMSA|nr:PREDICTED: uncharacterized protein LOC104750585 [Camelina sativa]